MNCHDCKHIGAKYRIGYRCHKLPEGLVGSDAEKWVRYPEKYHCDEHPCPDFVAK